MPFIPLNFLLQPSSSPENINFLTNFYAMFNNASAVNKTIINVEPLNYEGGLVGTEFLVYSANKLYVILSQTHYIPATNNIAYYDENNVLMFTMTAPAASAQMSTFLNVYFSRLTFTVLGSIFFVGYRITLV